MALSLQQLLALSQLNKIGRAKVIAIGKYTEHISCLGESELLDLLSHCISQKIITGIDKADYSIDMIHTAMNKAYDILQDSSRANITVLSFFDDLYPDNLRHIVKKKSSQSLDSPAFIYAKGDVTLLSKKKGVAIIGSREPTPEGIEASEYFAGLFARDGLNVISGLAIGCDSAAHQGALEANGVTTAILANGLDTVFPKENSTLAMQILEKGGLLLSEYPIKTKPLSNYFVERDRLQSGLANGTVVIQTSINGGTMHAVNATVENGKPLYVVQYNNMYHGGMLAKHENVQGNIMLISEGKGKPLTRNTYRDALNGINAFSLKAKDNSHNDSQLNIFI